VNPIQFHAVFSVLTASSAMSRFPVVVQFEFGRRSGWQNDCAQNPPLREPGRFQAEVCAAVQQISAADGIHPLGSFSRYAFGTRRWERGWLRDNLLEITSPMNSPSKFINRCPLQSCS
jgi:hypothetical protein